MQYSMQRNPIYMSDPMFDEISKKIKESYKNACILFIDEIVNPELEIEYEKHKQELLEKNNEPPNELLLFHGTHAKLIDIIAQNGFDPKENVTSAFGRGTYFAKYANYSKDYMKSADKLGVSYMIMAKVLLGKCGTIDNKNDTYINSTKPTIYVKPHRYGAIPKYIVAFHKNAT